MKHEVSLQQVLDRPDDDELRLVYADALSEQGDPRGELIAVQCAMANAPTEALRVREAELLRAHRDAWFGPVDRFLRRRNPQDGSAYRVRRGFVDHVRARLSAEPGEVTELFKLVPALRSLEVNGEGLTASDSLRRLRRLCVTGIIDALAELLSEGYFDQLKALELQCLDGEPGPGLARLKALTEFRSGWALRNLSLLPPKLRVLDAYGDDVLRTQLSAPRKALRELAVRSATLDAECIDAMIKQAPFVEMLKIQMSRATVPLLRRLFEAPWPKLKRLNLTGVSLQGNVESLQALRAPKLISVELTIAELRDEGARQLLRMPWLLQLQLLSLAANRLTDDGLEPLLEVKHRLSLLDLKKNRISNELFTRLQAAPSFRRTTILR